MKNSVNSLAIGMFVLGAALLTVAAVIIFGAAKFFEDDQYFASRFTETVNGLDVGAPVKFKGVKIGKVERISIGSPSKNKILQVQDRKDEDVVVVFYSIDLNLLKRRMRETGSESGLDWIKEQIKGGLRAKLNYQSIVTGMLYLELDYFAEANKELVIYETTRFIGIPSESSGLSELMKSMQDSIAKISTINFKEICENANKLIVNLNQKITDIDTKSLSDGAKGVMAKTDVLLDNTNNTIVKGGVLLDNANNTVASADVFIKNTDKNLTQLSNDIRKTLDGIDKLTNNLDSMTSSTSPLRFELATLLRSLNASMNSISNLTEYLQRNPNSLLTGKSQLKSKEK
ncbi:MAG: MCE family protein [Verrucomicrobiaceae bacterium]|nr:MCE family protein [Verrucomicrobiaceae bacterium]